MEPHRFLVNKKVLAKEILGGISERTVEHLVARKEIPFVKIGRRIMFDPSEVIEALKKASK